MRDANPALTNLVGSLSLGRISAGCADLLLDVEGDLATPPAQGVGLVAPLTKGTGTLGHVEAGLSSEILYRLVNHGWYDDVN